MWIELASWMTENLGNSLVSRVRDINGLGRDKNNAVRDSKLKYVIQSCHFFTCIRIPVENPMTTQQN